MNLGRRFFVNFFNYGLGQFLPKLINFLLIPVYAIYLSPEELGVYDIFYTLFLFLLVLMRFNLPGAITRFYFDYKGTVTLNSYVKTIYVSVIGSSLLVALIIFLLREPIMSVLDIDPIHGLYLLIVVCCAVLSGNGDIQKRMLQVREQSSYSAKLNVATTLVNILLSIFFVIIMDLGAIGLLCALLISSLIFFIQAQFYLKEYLQSSINFSFLPATLKYSMGVFPYLIIGHLNPLILKSFLSTTVSATAVGVFSMASRITSPLLLLISVFSSTITPIYFSILKEGNKDLNEYKKNITLIILGAFVLMIVFATWVPPLVEIFFPKTYFEAASTVSWLSLGFMPQLFYILISQDTFYSKRTVIVSVSNILGMILSLVVSLILIPTMQEAGLAIGTIVTPVFSFCFMYFFSKNSDKSFYNRYLFQMVYVSLILITWNFFLRDASPLSRLVFSIGLVPLFIIIHKEYRIALSLLKNKIYQRFDVTDY